MTNTRTVHFHKSTVTARGKYPLTNSRHGGLKGGNINQGHVTASSSDGATYSDEILDETERKDLDDSVVFLGRLNVPTLP